MDKRYDFFFSLVLIAAIAFLILYNYVAPLFITPVSPPIKTNGSKIEKLTLSDMAWRQKLTAQQYESMRNGAIEPAFSGQYVQTFQEGTYSCAACGLPLFSSKNKYDPKTGWASFLQPINSQAVWFGENRSTSAKSLRIFCSRCDSFLGILYYDGPPPKQERYSINSLALYFTPSSTP